MRLRDSIRLLLNTFSAAWPIQDPYRGEFYKPEEPDGLVEKLNIKQHALKGGAGFARADGESYWRVVQPLVRHAASVYQAVPATKHAHHRGYAGMLIHGVEVADDLVFQMRQAIAKGAVGDSSLLQRNDELTAIFFAYGLFHDLCNFKRDIRVFADFGKRPPSREAYEPLCLLEENTLYEFFKRRSGSASRYGWDFKQYRRLEPCPTCLRRDLPSVIRNAGVYVPRETTSAVLRPDSVFAKLLEEQVQTANWHSISKYRQDFPPVPYAAVKKQVQDSLRYCASNTGLFDNAPIGKGRFFLDAGTARQVPQHLPMYDDFIDAKKEFAKQRHAILVISKYCYCLDDLPNAFRGRRGALLSSQSQVGADLEHLRRHRRE